MAAMGLRQNTFERDLSAAEVRNVPVLVAHGVDSAISRLAVMRILENRHPRTQFVEVTHSTGKAGHTWGDNLRARAVLSQKVLHPGQ